MNQKFAKYALRAVNITQRRSVPVILITWLPYHTGYSVPIILIMWLTPDVLSL
jgi:hypothetical protein